jgi:hypothetical protein
MKWLRKLKCQRCGKLICRYNDFMWGMLFLALVSMIIWLGLKMEGI